MEYPESYRVYKPAGSSDLWVQHDVTGCRAQWSTREPVPSLELIQQMVDEHDDSCLFF